MHVSRAGTSGSIDGIPVETHNEGGKFRVLVTKNLPGTEWIDVLTSRGAQVDVCTSKETILDNATITKLIGSKCDAVIGQLTEDWSDELFSRLKAAGGRAYSNYAVGFNNINLGDASKHGIAVGNTPGVLTETTAELAAALTFAVSRRVVEADAFMRGGQYKGFLPDLFVGKLLQGKTLGLVGAGRIGTAYAKMMVEGHKMNLLYQSRRPHPQVTSYFESYAGFLESQGETPIAVKQVDLEELLRNSDVVSLHCALTPETRHLIDKEALQTMKPDAMLINTARGPVVDEAALVEHLRTNPAFSAGLDVYEDEPAMAPGLAECQNVVLMPHIASATFWTRSGMAKLAACNVMGVVQGYKAWNRGDDVLHFVESEIGVLPKLAPSILNAGDVGVGVEA